jgi:hypothetical protein
MPALIKRMEGSFSGTREKEGKTRWSLSLKKSR